MQLIGCTGRGLAYSRRGERPRGILCGMHWGNIGSMLAGVSTIIIAVAALIRSPGALRDWRARQLAEAEAATARAENERAQAEQVALDRRRTLSGWSPGGVTTWTVTLFTDPLEMDRAKRELTSDGPTDYVVLKVDEGPGGSANRAREMRAMIDGQHFISTVPTVAEREALETGLSVLDIPSNYRREPPSVLQDRGTQPS